MSYFVYETENISKDSIALDDMILTTDGITSAGSKMLYNFKSLFCAEVVSRLEKAGLKVGGKVKTGEFALDLLGETCYQGVQADENGILEAPAVKVLDQNLAKAVICLDVNGYPRRAAGLSNKVFIKPTYGVVSRYGVIPGACSGETVGVMANSSQDCKEVLEKIACHDEKDGTSLDDSVIEKALTISKTAKKVAVLKEFVELCDDQTKEKINEVLEKLKDSGLEVQEISSSEILVSQVSWNILMTAEVCNNVSRYDGVKFGYRAEDYRNIDELYVKSRTEAFGAYLKSVVMLGSSVLANENYDRLYDKSLRVRRVVKDWFEKAFESFDAVIIPCASKCSFSAKDVSQQTIYEESVFTAPASITGLPCVSVSNVQLIGDKLTDAMLLDIAKVLE